MKKAFYMMAAAAIALSSCSSEETTDVAKSSAITFRTSVGLNSRGAELTTDNIQNMWVSAFDQDNGTCLFPDEEFTKDKAPGSTTFAPVNAQYWLKGKKYKFVAISPAKAEWPVDPVISKDEVKCTDLTPAIKIADQKDLVIGAVNATSADHQAAGVGLTLNHILSQIQIKVKNTNDKIVYRIKGIRIVNVNNNKGTLTYNTTNNTSAWDYTGATKTTYTNTFDEAIELDGNTTEPVTLTGDNGGAMIIPQTITPWDSKKVTTADSYNEGTYISLLLNVKTKNGVYMYPSQAEGKNSFGWVAVAVPNTEWAIGNKYIYTLDMSYGCGKVDPVEPNPDGGGTVKPGDKDPDKGENVFGDVIKFKVEVKDWATDATFNGDINM